MISKPTTILGIDPGFALTGFGLISSQGQHLKFIDYGCIETLAGEDFSERLKYLHLELKKVISKFKPDIVAVEEIFFAKNVTTAVKVSQARGVILLTAIQANLPLLEFTPLQVKQAVSGYGRADKKQIQQMVKMILRLKETPQPDDAADALAVAICAASSHKLLKTYDNK